MANSFDKEALFGQYFDFLVEVVPTFADVFEIHGMTEQVLGVAQESRWVPVIGSENGRREATERVRQSRAWSILSRLYDYAVQGFRPEDVEPEEIVIAGNEVLTMLEHENAFIPDAWKAVVQLGDARFSLDDGGNLTLDNVALLAGVDVRTVRNAVSSGHLESPSRGWVSGVSARKWLAGRRAFIPTKVVSDKPLDLSGVQDAGAFASVLKSRRDALAISLPNDDGADAPGSLDDGVVTALESGTFHFPLDIVDDLAKYYQLNGTEFLRAVMRVFYPDQLSILASIASK